jgi:hypothetical protein
MPVLGLADRLNTAIPPADVDDAEAVKRLINRSDAPAPTTTTLSTADMM